MDLIPEDSTTWITWMDDYSSLLTIDCIHTCVSHKITYKRYKYDEENVKILKLFEVGSIPRKDAINQLMSLPRFKKALKNLRFRKKVKFNATEFVEHLSLYLSGCHRDSYFHFEKDDRFPHQTFQPFRVVANRNIKKGVTLKTLSGIMCPATDTILNGYNDFSIMDDDDKRPNFLLGPLSFVNHSCKPNGHYFRHKNDPTVFFKSLQNISKGEELTANYGPQYFEKQEICLCIPCINAKVIQNMKNRVTRSKITIRNIPEIFLDSLKRKSVRAKKINHVEINTPTPTKDNPFPLCPARTAIGNFIIKVTGHVVRRRRLAVWVTFFQHQDVKISIETLQNCANGVESFRDYMDSLYYINFKKWLVVAELNPELAAPKYWLTTCKKQRQFRFKCSKPDPSWYQSRIQIGPKKSLSKTKFRGYRHVSVAIKFQGIGSEQQNKRASSCEL